MAGLLIAEPRLVSAWAAAAAHVYSAGPSPTFMVVSAENQFPDTADCLAEVGKRAAALGAERPGTVAEVLMPRPVLGAEGSPQTRIEAGWKLFGRGRSRHLKFSGWRHTYFERLTGHWMDRDLNLHEIKENRLRAIIDKMNAWGRDIEAAFFVHTDSTTDRLRTLGAPCLQYVQFRPFQHDRLELFALYRSHDYFHKALGNMIGLQRLGQFVASETGRTFVRQTIFSVHPMNGGSKKSLKELVTSVTAIPGI